MWTHLLLVIHHCSESSSRLCIFMRWQLSSRVSTALSSKILLWTPKFLRCEGKCILTAEYIYEFPISHARVRYLRLRISQAVQVLFNIFNGRLALKGFIQKNWTILLELCKTSFYKFIKRERKSENERRQERKAEDRKRRQRQLIPRSKREREDAVCARGTSEAVTGETRRRGDRDSRQPCARGSRL